MFDGGWLPTGCDAESGQPHKLCQNAPMLEPAGRCQQRVPRSTTPGKWQEQGVLAASHPTPGASLRRGSHCRNLPRLGEGVPTKTRPAFGSATAVRHGRGAGNRTRRGLIHSTVCGAHREHAGVGAPRGKAASGSTVPFWKRAGQSTRHATLPVARMRAAVRPGCAARSMALGWGASLDPFLARLATYVHRLL